MSLSRRHFLQGLAVIPAAAVISSNNVVRALSAPMMTTGKRLVMLDLRGGNDGFNTVIPYNMAGGNYATVFRPGLAVTPGKVLPLDAQVGLHQAFTELKTHYDAGRLAVVHGVGYPDPDFSHEVSQQIWQTGDPTKTTTSGWLGRHLASQGAPISPNAMSVTSSVQPLLQGSGSYVPAFQSLGGVTFPYDYENWQDRENRRAAYLAMSQAAQLAGGDVGAMGSTGESILDLIDLLSDVPEFEHVGTYGDDEWFNQSLRLVVRLIAAGVGLENFHVLYGGFDTHAAQNVGGFHEGLLASVSKGRGVN